MTIRRNVCPAALATILLVTTLFAGCATGTNRASLPEPPALAVRTEMPDPLRMLNGKRITSLKQWIAERRPELKALFQHYMYGAIPRQSAGFHATLVHEFPDFLGGGATLKLLTLETGAGRAPKIDLMIVLPNQIKGRAPLFLAMNFCGNHALDTDPRIPLAKCRLYNNCKGCTNNTATAASRGGQAVDWPLAEIVRRGYGVATFCSSDVDSDRAEVSDGVYAWLAEGDATRK